MMRIAVTGATGQLGSVICELLGNRASALRRVDLDLNELRTIQPRLIALAPAAVIHCAAYTQVDRAEADPTTAFRINGHATEQIAAVCAQLNIPLVYISSDYVFCGAHARTTPFRETDCASPSNVYAASKLLGEQAAQNWERHLIVRTCGLYTHSRSGDGPPNFVRAVLGAARDGKVVRVVDDQVCTPTYVPHLARAVLFLLDRSACGTYHVVSGGHTSWHDFAAELFRLKNMSVRLEPMTSAAYGSMARRPPYSVLDTTKYLALGGPAMPSWQSALLEFVCSEVER